MSDAIREARERFGKPFAHEPGSTWKPESTFYLDRWKAEQMKERQEERKQ